MVARLGPNRELFVRFVSDMAEASAAARRAHRGLADGYASRIAAVRGLPLAGAA